MFSLLSWLKIYLKSFLYEKGRRTDYFLNWFLSTMQKISVNICLIHLPWYQPNISASFPKWYNCTPSTSLEIRNILVLLLPKEGAEGVRNGGHVPQLFWSLPWAPPMLPAVATRQPASRSSHDTEPPANLQDPWKVSRGCPGPPRTGGLCVEA